MAGLRSWHLAAVGAALQVLFAAYALAKDPPRETLDVVTHAFVALLLVAGAALAAVVAGLLAFPASHRAGRWAALALGVLATAALFWAPEGLLLLAAFGWASWKERPERALLGDQAAPSTR